MDSVHILAILKCSRGMKMAGYVAHDIDKEFYKICVQKLEGNNQSVTPCGRLEDNMITFVFATICVPGYYVLVVSCEDGNKLTNFIKGGYFWTN
jgi:hypothetical protein